MSIPQFVDISEFQPSLIDWQAYKVWSAQGDGISRVAMRTSYGVGYTDQHLAAYRQGAIDAGIDVILFYHYGYPQYNTAIDEANWQHTVVGNIRPNDLIILDFEENVNAATSDWAYSWLTHAQALWGQKVGIYSYPDFIANHLQDNRLAQFPLWYTNWTFDPNTRPQPPSPWIGYAWLQYTDNAQNIPGINAIVDVDIFIGGTPMPPNGWVDDGITLTATNGHKVVLGFRDYILNNNWDPANVPLEEESGVDPVAEYYTEVPSNGTRQLFAFNELAWNPTRGIYLVQIGQELAGCRNARNNLERSVNDLQAQITALQNQPIKTDVKNFIASLQKLQQDGQ